VSNQGRSSIAVLGGCGHVGLPLALTFAAAGHDVTIVDIDSEKVEALRRGVLHFREDGAEELLARHIGKNLAVTTDQRAISSVEHVVCVVGTPIDEHLNPQVDKLRQLVDSLGPHLHDGQLFVLRSTVYPGVTQHLHGWMTRAAPGVDVAFCPERVAQGHSIKEIGTLPQIISAPTPRALERARALFSTICSSVLELEPTEAELAKLFCNAWRYISFAVANQFYSLCAENGIDYYRVHRAITTNYPRMSGLPTAGFAAGPCLFKDTMQLAAYYNNEFSLGQDSMLVNEGLPRVLMQQLRPLGLGEKTVGILGMAFKAESDDARDSLAFKLRKLLALECKEVLCTDEHVRAPGLLPLDEVLARADVLVIGAPHARYRGMTPRQPTLDPWNVLGRGGLLQ
jgi:UDP-N-acetyl-D-mannosaminuronic acid dehydrogenase